MALQVGVVQRSNLRSWKVRQLPMRPRYHYLLRYSLTRQLPFLQFLDATRLCIGTLFALMLASTPGNELDRLQDQMNHPEDTPTAMNSLLLRFILFTVLLTKTACFSGAYSVVYVGTMYLYCWYFVSVFKKASRRGAVIVAFISISYICSLAEILCQWALGLCAINVTGMTQNTITATLSRVPLWYGLVQIVCYFIIAFVADVLLVSMAASIRIMNTQKLPALQIWRCYHVWGRSIRAVLLPLMLGFGATDQNALIGAALFLDLASSLASSGAIAYRISMLIKRDFRNKWSFRFRHAIEIVVQSAAVYSAVTIAYATVSVLPTDAEKLFGTIDAARLYLADLFVFTAGIAPTVMFARVLATPSKKDDTDTTEVIQVASDLEFRSNAKTYSTPRATYSIFSYYNFQCMLRIEELPDQSHRFEGGGFPNLLPFQAVTILKV
ncbi:hypothetical protein CVT26_002598 [Gymnopilus dilepis]|uniref:Uncharacterized protein n=1 Tax=Gymnopilus dilepis TaxID=231916 RepID=A0A409VF52_9AGAR|nr:hypothetical protein CVT26_002598 [Gymnopilus dilepis]